MSHNDIEFFIHDDGYRNDTINGKSHISNFKNVLITDNKNIQDSNYDIWIRVWKDSEKQDMFIVNLIQSAPELLETLKECWGECKMSKELLAKVENVISKSEK